jgi:hypothetical protein
LYNIIKYQHSFMKNRSLVITLTVAYAGLVCGAIALGSPANLLGSTLNFFSEPAAIEQLQSFDADDNAVPDFINAERILEIFVSSPQWLTPLLGQPMRMPGMIRIDERFFTMPGDHTAAPATFSEEDYPAFDVVEPLWTSDTIQLSPEFEGGASPAQNLPAPFLVPSISPSSSLPASLMMPTAPTAPSSTPPSVTAPPSSTPPVTSAPPAVVPVTATSSTMNSCSDGLNPDGDAMMDMADMDGGTQCDTVAATSGGSASTMNSCNDGMNPDGDAMMDMSDMDGGTQCDTVGATSGGSFSTGFMPF